jgi:hypothetical protein
VKQKKEIVRTRMKAISGCPINSPCPCAYPTVERRDWVVRTGIMITPEIEAAAVEWYAACKATGGINFTLDLHPVPEILMAAAMAARTAAGPDSVCADGVAEALAEELATGYKNYKHSGGETWGWLWAKDGPDCCDACGAQMEGSGVVGHDNHGREGRVCPKCAEFSRYDRAFS